MGAFLSSAAIASRQFKRSQTVSEEELIRGISAFVCLCVCVCVCVCVLFCYDTKEAV